MAINYEYNNITGSGSLFINNSGNFASGLYVNNIPVSLSGHSHSNVVFTTGNQNISGIKTFFDNIVSSGQISAPSGKFDYITSDKDFTINGTLNINAAASILASGPITFVGNPYVVSGAGYFTSGLFVGPTGSATAVSLSGHRQSYSTIDNFCTGVAECVNTPLLAGTGISLSYVNGTGLYINASGIQILSSSSGFVVKTGINNYTTRLISNGNNINISYADGISANPIIELSGSLDLIKDITSTGNLKANSGIFSSGITLNGTGVSLSGHTHSISDITSLQTTLDSKQPSLTNPVTGVGTSGYLTKWISSSGISSGVIFDNGTNIGIGTTSPAANLHVNGSGIFSSGLNINGSISIDNNQLYINKTGIFLPFGSSLIPAIKFSGYTTSTFATMDTVICNELNVNNSLYLSTSEDPQTSPGLFFSTNGEGVAGISSNTYGDTVTILANNLRNSLVESATFDSFGINTENLYATSTQSQFVNTQTITAQDLLVKQGVIKVNNSYNNAYSMTINSSGINIVYNAGNAEVKYTDPVELPTALVTSNLISAYTITSDYFILPNYQIGELVLFKEFTGANAVYNGIYSIQNTSPVVAGNIRLVRASGYTNGTTLNDGFSVNVSNNNIQQKYVLNGTSIIGTNNLIFSPDLGESVMSLASNKNISFAEGIYAKEKYFKIKHPDPDSGYSFLQYGSLESPYHGVRLTGKDKLKNGICEILLPDYLKYLIHEEDVSIQLTNYGHHKMLYVDKIDLKNNKFIVKGYRSKSGGPFNFYWSFTGIRKDVPNLIPEQ